MMEMLWRSTYQTERAYGIAWPIVSGVSPRAVLGLSSLVACHEVEIWDRLLVSEGLPFEILNLGDLKLDSVWPPSMLKNVSPAQLSGFEAYSPGDRGFAAVVAGSIAQVVMWGPPTEGAWDEFKDFLLR